MSRTIFDVLREDHDKQRTLIKLVGRTHGDSLGRRELFERLRAEAVGHAAIEERAFYAPLLALEMTREKAGHSVHEHHQIDDLFEELAQRSMADGGWLQRFRSLADKLLHHLEEEEQQIFQLAGRALVDEQKHDMARHYLREKPEATRKARIPISA